MSNFGKPVIIIPAFDEAEFIGRTLGLVHGSGVDANVLVVDDGSKDKTAEIAAAKGVKVLRIPENFGKAFAFISGVKKAVQSRPIAIVSLDADMLKATAAGLNELIQHASNATLKKTSAMFVTSVREGGPDGYCFSQSSGMRSFSLPAVEKLSKLRIGRFKTKYVGYGLEKFLNFYFGNESKELFLSREFHAAGAHRKGALRQDVERGNTSRRIEKLSAFLNLRERKKIIRRQNFPK
ncbi:MAG: glycosyltransferase [Candidatus Diapherotrites archaeon]|nr:glycosyltransferase [Candidatus Diapherotrites archaeon]